MRNESEWEQQFAGVWRRGIAAWDAGRRKPAAMFGSEDGAWLASFGYSRQELFDFVDDFRRHGEPDVATALAIAAIRREYFLRELAGRLAERQRLMAELPAKTAEVEGIAWLPRLLMKARWKLRGEMPDDLMYGCGGDRDFLRTARVTAAEFLRLVWANWNDDRKTIEAVKARMKVRT